MYVIYLAVVGPKNLKPSVHLFGSLVFGRKYEALSESSTQMLTYIRATPPPPRLAAAFAPPFVPPSLKVPFSYNIGQGSVIKGWDEGVMDMGVGERAKLTCTPDYAYGEGG